MITASRPEAAHVSTQGPRDDDHDAGAHRRAGPGARKGHDRTGAPAARPVPRSDTAAPGPAGTPRAPDAWACPGTARARRARPGHPATGHPRAGPRHPADPVPAPRAWSPPPGPCGHICPPRGRATTIMTPGALEITCSADACSAWRGSRRPAPRV